MKKKFVVIAVLVGISVAGSAFAQLRSAVDLSKIPLHERLMASTTDLLGSKAYPNGDVEYAYKTHPITETSAQELKQLERSSHKKILKENIAKRTPHARIYTTSEPGVEVAEIISGEPQFYKDENGRWWQVDYATTTTQSWNVQVSLGTRASLLALFVKTALACTSPCIFYPDAGTSGVTSVDGNVNYQDASSWSTAHDAASGNILDRDGVNSIYAQSTYHTNSLYYIGRGLMNFDTSALGAGVTVSAATFSGYGVGVENANSCSASLVGNTGASSTSYSTSDYNQIGSTKYASDITCASWSTTGYNDFAMNATGLAAINATGVTKLGFRLSNDLNNTAPTGHNAAGFASSDTTGTANDPKLVVTFSSNSPIAPVNLQVESQSNPNIATSNPRFSALVQSASTTALAVSYEIQVSTSAVFASYYWDSGQKTLSSSTPANQRTPQIYSTTTFPLDGTTYYWRMKLWDQTGVASLYSTSTDSFTTLISYPTTTLQDLIYSYDKVGNITQIIDKSGTGGAGTSTYAYDNLYRLTGATTTNSLVNYSQSYIYDWLGNVQNKSDVGSYTYGATGYANPDAATQIGLYNQSFDQAGNLLSSGNNLSTSTYTWDYRNRQTFATNNGTNTAYLYDASDARVSQAVKKGSGATSTTSYVNQFYEVTGATTTMYLFAGGQLLATIEGNGKSTTTGMVHTDQLGGTNVVSSASGTLAQLANYYPYGGIRQNQQQTTFNEKRKYIGQYYDDSTALSYLNARFYDGTRGQFTGEDPILLGTPDAALLIFPQAMNFYSYSTDNPITKEDPSGKLRSDLVLSNYSGLSFAAGATQGTYLGVPIVSNGANNGTANATYSCVDFVKNVFAKEYPGLQLGGSANHVAADYGDPSTAPSVLGANGKTVGQLSVNKQGGSVMPRQGDIVSYGGSVGHAGIISEVDATGPNKWTVYTVEQNQSARNGHGEPEFQQTLTYTTNTGYTLSSKNQPNALPVQSWDRYTPANSCNAYDHNTAVTQPTKLK
jgi:RHS repeat-associated protein